MKLKLFDGYVSDLFFYKKGEWPTTITFLNDSTGILQKLDRFNDVDSCIKYIADSCIIVPQEMLPYNTLLKHTSGKCDAEFIKEIYKYNNREESSFDGVKKKRT